MVDPVCLKRVDADSTRHCIHGGALFSFCSDECRASFAADPSRWAVAAALGGLRIGGPEVEHGFVEREAPAAVSPEKDDNFGDTVVYRRPLNASPPQTSAPWIETHEEQPLAAGEVDVELEISEETARTPISEPTGQFTRPPVVPRARPAETGDGARHEAAPVLSPKAHAFPARRSNLFSPLAALRERHSATVCCRELLKLYQSVAAEHPGQDRSALYRHVVMSRTGHDAAAADAVLRAAEESFASWPASRDLNFRDVVHYLAVSEFLAAHPESRWLHADMRRIVQSSIPREL
jgi:YHS domain-containing protein